MYSVSVKGQKEYKIFVYRKQNSDDSFPAISSECDYPFLIEKWKAEKIMKKFSELINK